MGDWLQTLLEGDFDLSQDEREKRAVTLRWYLSWCGKNEGCDPADRPEESGGF